MFLDELFLSTAIIIVSYNIILALFQGIYVACLSPHRRDSLAWHAINMISIDNRFEGFLRRHGRVASVSSAAPSPFPRLFHVSREPTRVINMIIHVAQAAATK